MKVTLFIPVMAEILIESKTDFDSAASYYEAYTPELAQWIEKGYPGIANCKVTVKCVIDWENFDGPGGGWLPWDDSSDN